MTKPARVYLPFDRSALVALDQSGEVGADFLQGFEADPEDEDETYDALVAADDASPDHLVVEVDAVVAERLADGRVTLTSAARDQVVAFYSDLGWFGVQEIGLFLR